MIPVYHILLYLRLGKKKEKTNFWSLQVGGTTPWSTSCCPLPLSLCPKGDENRYCMCLKYDLYILTIMMILSAYVQIWIQYSQYITNLLASRSSGPWARKWVPTSVWVWHVIFCSPHKGIYRTLNHWPWLLDGSNLYFIDSCCACSTLWVSLKLGDTQQCKWTCHLISSHFVNMMNFYCCLEVAQASASLGPPPGMAPALYLIWEVLLLSIGSYK